MNHSQWMIYGANGHTGRMIAREAVARRLRPILAGRSRRRIKALAAELGCDCRVFPLHRADRIVEELTGVPAVLHCAGPFSATGEPMMDACLRAATNYLDITGEIDVIEAAAARHDRAIRAGVSLIPAVGFDVVPSDCLAALLAERLPGATRLQLAFTAPGRLSRGTARTILEGLPRGGRVRQDGLIAKVPIAWKSMQVPFRDGPRWAMTVPWGDVASAWHTTGIPNIEVYTAVPRQQIEQIRDTRWVLPLLAYWPIRLLFRRAVLRAITGPKSEQSETDRASFWGRVSDAAGNSAEATLQTPGGYQLTVSTALASLERVLNGGVAPGFQTPAQAFGPEFIQEIPEIDFRWES